MKYIKRIERLYEKAKKYPNIPHMEGNYLSFYDNKNKTYFLRHYNTVIFDINYNKRLYAIDGYSLTDKNAVYTLLKIHGIYREFRTLDYIRYLIGWDNEIYTFIGFGKYEDRISGLIRFSEKEIKDW